VVIFLNQAFYYDFSIQFSVSSRLKAPSFIGSAPIFFIVQHFQRLGYRLDVDARNIAT